jgi:hypothetical protein
MMREVHGMRQCRVRQGNLECWSIRGLQGRVGITEEMTVSKVDEYAWNFRGTSRPE